MQFTSRAEPRFKLKKSPAERGFFLFVRLAESGEGRLINYRLRVPGPLSKFPQNLRRYVLAGAATSGHAELALQAAKILYTGFRRLADLLVSNGVADADVHKFNHLARFMAFNCKCE